MVRRPPNFLVTTPESLYLLVTAERSRATLRAVRTVIVDEIHAVARDKRGSHLALTLERLARLCATPPARRSRRQRRYRAHPIVVNHDHLARLDLAHILGAHQVECAGLGRDDHCVVNLADHQRPEPELIAHRDQAMLRQHDQRIRAAYLRQRLDHASRQVGGMAGGDQMNYQLAVRGGLENRTAGFESLAQFLEIDKVAVMRERKSAACVLDHERLAVLEIRRTGSRVAIVANRSRAFEPVDNLGIENVGDQSHPAMRDERLAVG